MRRYYCCGCRKFYDDSELIMHLISAIGLSRVYRTRCPYGHGWLVKAPWRLTKHRTA